SSRSQESFTSLICARGYVAKISFEPFGDGCVRFEDSCLANSTTSSARNPSPRARLCMSQTTHAMKARIQTENGYFCLGGRGAKTVFVPADSSVLHRIVDTIL